MADVKNTPSTGAVFIPEKWAADTIRERDAVQIAAKLFKRYDQDVANDGDTVNVPLITRHDVKTYTPGSDVEAQANTELEVSLKLDQFKTIVFEIDDTLSKQSKYDLANEYKTVDSQALGEDIDAAVLAEIENADTYVGSGSAALTDEDILSARKNLNVAKVPLTNRFFIVHPSCEAQLLNMDKFVRYDSLGTGKAIEDGKLGNIYGMPVYMSQLVVVESGTPNVVHNVMAHKDAIALAVQKDISWEQNRPARRHATEYKALCMYGVKTLRDDHMVDVRTSESLINNK